MTSSALIPENSLTHRPPENLIRYVTHKSIRLLSLIPGSARVVWRGPASGTAIALTFDDGPEPRRTNAISEVLADNEAPASFFVLVEKAERAPSLIRDLVAAGHEINLHSDRHERLDLVPVTKLAGRLAGARRDLEDLIGRRVRYFRPPFGRTSWRTLLAARRAELEIALWSHDALDWMPREPQVLDASIKGCLVPGAIVLLHDDAGGYPDQGWATAASLRRVLSHVRSEISPVTLSRLCSRVTE